MQKRYWLRGGIIGAVSAILVVFVFQVGDFTGAGFDNLFLILFLFAPIFLMAGLPFTVLYPICAVIWFFLGSILGWLYGKIVKNP